MNLFPTPLRRGEGKISERKQLRSGLCHPEAEPNLAAGASYFEPGYTCFAKDAWATSLSPGGQVGGCGTTLPAGDKVRCCCF